MPSGSERDPEGLLKRITKNTSIGLLASVVFALLLWGRTFLLARSLSIEDFGWIVICLNFFSFANLIIRPGIPETLYRFYPDFETKQDADGRASLLWLSFYICAATGIIIASGVFSLSDWIVGAFYENPALSSYLKLLSVVFAFALLKDSASAVLRLKNRYFLALLPNVIGAAIQVAGIVFDIRSGEITIHRALTYIAVGEGVTLLLLSVFVALAMRESVQFSWHVMSLTPLKGSWRRVRSSFGQASLFGILRSGSEIGGIFLLGLLGTPRETAILGMAIQLTRPLSLVQNNLAGAVTPEITRLYPKKQLGYIMKMIHRFGVLGLCALFVGLILSWLTLPAILEFLRPEYLEAMPVFMILFSSQCLMLMTIPLFPLAMAKDELGRRNLTVSIRFIYLGIAVALGLSAVSVAIVQLAGSLTTRFFNDVPLYRSILIDRNKSVKPKSNTP